VTLVRILETEVMEGYEEASEYDSMDHSQVNSAFVDDLLAAGDLGFDVVDLGTGTALIPLELCRRFEDCRIMAVDLSVAMLDLARLHIEIGGMTHRIQLDQADWKKLHHANEYFDVVLSNGSLHHLPDPLAGLREAVRVARPGALLFLRDLLRPESEEQLEQLVQTYAGECTERQQAQFAASFRAALQLNEVRELVGQLGFALDTVQQTSDRHWTWCARKIA
jgi:ubiquinone/menaquinone biosynthesis C-methylase UbiE